MADKITGSTKPGVPGDATGNVHIFYQDETLVGDRAHYDGVRTITVTGDPYIINNTKDSVLYADKIVFDTVAEKAELINGRGQSAQGVEQGLVYYSAKDLRSDQHGVAHGDYASVSS
jgi:lipopolysaccharide assembly outer membrane protein LptD (OstA)